MIETDDHLIVATHWLQAVLLGSTGTAIATIAIALVGIGLLTGRVDVRRGLSVVVGCFVLFGAPAIAAGLLGVVPRAIAAAPPTPAFPPPVPTPAPSSADPYAGAAVPSNR